MTLKSKIGELFIDMQLNIGILTLVCLKSAVCKSVVDRTNRSLRFALLNQYDESSKSNPFSFLHTQRKKKNIKIISAFNAHCRPHLWSISDWEFFLGFPTESEFVASLDDEIFRRYLARMSSLVS